MKELFEAVLDAPAEDAPRLVYANCLDEDGDFDRAEFIRVQCKLAKPAKGRLVALRRREQELWQKHGADWCPDVYDRLHIATYSDCVATIGATTLVFRRGFVDRITLPLIAWVGGVCTVCLGEQQLRCAVCGGVGELPALGPRLVRACPLDPDAKIPAVQHVVWHGYEYWHDAVSEKRQLSRTLILWAREQCKTLDVKR